MNDMNEKQKILLNKLVNFFANEANITSEHEIQNTISNISKLSVDDAIDKIIVSLENLVKKIC